MNISVVRSIVNIVALALTIGVNAVANILPLNGKTTGEISNQFSVLITPAGYVFSIWTLIYIGLIAYVVYQALPKHRTHKHIRALDPWFVLSCVANIGWIFAWHYEQITLSLVPMIILLASLAMMYRILHANHSIVSPAEKWSVYTTISIYLAWISLATIVNVAVVLYVLNWSGFGIPAEYWTGVMMTVTVVLAAFMAWRFTDTAFVLVVLWAIIGIMIKFDNRVLIAQWGAILFIALSGLAVWNIMQIIRRA